LKSNCFVAFSRKEMEKLPIGTAGKDLNRGGSTKEL